MEKSWQIAERIWAAEISPTEKLVALAVLHHRSSQTGLCFPSRERLAVTCGVSVRVVQRALSALKASGLLADSGHLGRFALLAFVPRVKLRVMGDAHDTPGVTSASPQSPFKKEIGEELEEEQ